jgi:glycerol uptake facilitator-like aquaporin
MPFATMPSIMLTRGRPNISLGKRLIRFLSPLSAVDQKYQVRNEVVYRLIYEEKRLYIHEEGGERPTTTIRNRHSVDISTSSAFWNESVATALLVCIIFALGDDQNSPPGAGMNAFIIDLVVLLLGLTMGYNTGPCVNPAWGTGTKLVALMAGYGTETFRNWW